MPPEPDLPHVEPVPGDDDAQAVAALAEAFADHPAPRYLIGPAGEAFPERERAWGLLGPDARARYGDLGERWGRLAAQEPHVHLNLVGVRPAERGRGLGVALVRAIVARSRAPARGRRPAVADGSAGASRRRVVDRRRR